MAVTQFIADKNKTVTVNGVLYNLSLGDIPDGVSVYINDVALVAGTPAQILSLIHI